MSWASDTERRRNQGVMLDGGESPQDFTTVYPLMKAHGASYALQGRYLLPPPALAASAGVKGLAPCRPRKGGILRGAATPPTGKRSAQRGRKDAPDPLHQHKRREATHNKAARTAEHATLFRAVGGNAKRDRGRRAAKTRGDPERERRQGGGEASHEERSPPDEPRPLWRNRERNEARGQNKTERARTRAEKDTFSQSFHIFITQYFKIPVIVFHNAQVFCYYPTLRPRGLWLGGLRPAFSTIGERCRTAAHKTETLRSIAGWLFFTIVTTA